MLPVHQLEMTLPGHLGGGSADDRWRDFAARSEAQGRSGAVSDAEGEALQRAVGRLMR
jgi:hypothetical protein